MRTPGLTGAMLGVAAVFGLSWITAIAYWRLGTGVPGPGEIAGLMLGVPATLVGVMAWWGRGRRPAMDPAVAPAPETEDHDTKAPGHARFAIVGASLELPLGSVPADVVRRSGDGAGLALHPWLRDPQGFGVLAAEAPALDTTKVAAELAALDHASMPDRCELARALALAGPVLDRLLEPGSQVPVAAGLLLPTDWSDTERDLARDWVVQRLCAAAPKLQRNTEAFAVANGQELLEMLCHPVVPAPGAGPVLWLALASNIGPATVERWARRGCLLSARLANGRAPGEAAAGVILDAATNGDPRATVHFPGTGSASAASNGDGLAAQVAEVLSTTATDPNGIGLVVSDFDHRPTLCTQLATAVSTHLPRLDTARGVLRLGQSCGHADAVLALASLVLGAHSADEAGHATLVVAGDARNAPALALVKPPASAP